MSLPSDALIVANLLRIAAQDLDGAQRLAAAGNRNAPYLCQQAAEKTLKGYLTSYDKPFKKTHDLDELSRACLEVDSTLQGVGNTKE